MRTEVNTVTVKKAERGESKANRQCWECLKRRLVCDHTLPHCKKCQKAGRECPGYDEQKPLQWVETGKVTSRRGRKDCPPTIYRAPQPKPSQRTTEETIDASIPFVNLDDSIALLSDISLDTERPAPLTEQELNYKIWKHSNDAVSKFLANEYDTRKAQEIHDLFVMGGKECEKIFALGGRDKIEEVVARGDHEEASRLLGTVDYPLVRLERVLSLMRMHDLPSYNYLSNETSEVVQAVNYYNVRILPSAMTSSEMAPNPALILVPLGVLHILPPAIHHTMVCLALNHFVHCLPSGADKSVAVVNKSKVYHHRGAAIRALSQYVGRDKTRCSDFTIASIQMFMSLELQNPTMADWRSHANGMQQLIDMRGGVKNLVDTAPHLAATVVIFMLIVHMGNTSSPPWDQIQITGTPEENLEDIREMYNLIFPYTLCPPELFLNVIRVNQLRKKASASVFVGDVEPTHCLEAQDLLSDIEAFIPEDWAQPGDHYPDWLLIGTVFQSAAALYCTMSFQSLTILPNTLEMNSMRAVHGDRLRNSLKEAIKSPRLNNYLIWPFAVAGVEAGYRDSSTQYWVEKQYTLLSRKLGTSSPLKAQAVMRRYWQKGEPGWDECFDRPYVFVI